MTLKAKKSLVAFCSAKSWPFKICEYKVSSTFTGSIFWLISFFGQKYLANNKINKITTKKKAAIKKISLFNFFVFILKSYESEFIFWLSFFQELSFQPQLEQLLQLEQQW